MPNATHPLDRSPDDLEHQFEQRLESLLACLDVVDYYDHPDIDLLRGALRDMQSGRWSPTDAKALALLALALHESHGIVVAIGGLGEMDGAFDLHWQLSRLLTVASMRLGLPAEFFADRIRATEETI
jgi:hypothetical protein